MNEIKYRKGDIVKEVDSCANHYYIFKILKDIPLNLWNNNHLSFLYSEYAQCMYRFEDNKRYDANMMQMYTREGCRQVQVKQSKINHMNTALYKILHKGEINEDIDNIFINN